MPPSKKRPQTIATGGGACIGGQVDTGGGDFVGRDQIKTRTQHREGVAVEDLLGLLGEVRALLPQAGLEPALAEAIAGEFQAVQRQASERQPKSGPIRARLQAMAELIQETGKTSEAADQVLQLLAKGAALAGTLF